MYKSCRLDDGISKANNCCYIGLITVWLLLAQRSDHHIWMALSDTGMHVASTVHIPLRLSQRCPYQSKSRESNLHFQKSVHAIQISPSSEFPSSKRFAITSAMQKEGTLKRIEARTQMGPDRNSPPRLSCGDLILRPRKPPTPQLFVNITNHHASHLSFKGVKVLYP